MEKISIRNLVCLCAIIMSSVTYAMTPLTIESFEMEPDEIKIIQVIGSDIIPLTGFQTNISLPDGLSFISFDNEYAEMESTCSISESPELFVISTYLQGSTLKIVSYTLDYSSCYSPNKPWFRIKVKSSDRFDGGKIIIHDTYVTSVYSMGAQYNQDKEWKLDDIECVVTRVVKPQNIQLSQESLELQAGESARIEAKVLPENATDKTLTWSSSDEAVATVNENGLITAISKGEAVVTVKSSNSISASCNIKVLQSSSVEDIYLTETTLSMGVGGEHKLGVEIIPSDASEYSIRWNSSDESVATVDQEGFIKAWKRGTVVIKAETSNGLSATCEVLVEDRGIKLEMNERATLTGEIFSLGVINIIDTDSEYQWSSSDELIASVDQEGNITALKVGTVRIGVENHAGYKSYCLLYIMQGPTKINLSETEITLKAGEERQLTYKLEPDFSVGDVYKWESNNPSIVSVDGSGLLVAGFPGKAKITANTVNNVTASCEVEVIPLTESIYFEHETLSMQVGENKRITPIISPAEVLEKDIAWESSNSKICSVENGIISANSAGDCTITATTFDGVAASCTVIVTQPAEGIVLSFYELEINVGDEYELIATLYPVNSSDKTIEWHTSDENVAVVSGGVIHGLASGSCIITASALNGVTASCNLTVIQPAVEIILSDTTLELNEGELFTLKAEVMPENAADKSVTWTSSDTSIATVDEDGTIYALSAGKVIITAEAINGVTASCYVTVKEVTGINSVGSDKITISVEGNKLFINGADKLNIPLIIYSIDGRVVYSGNDTLIESLSPGIYIVRISDKSIKFTIR